MKHVNGISPLCLNDWEKMAHKRLAEIPNMPTTVEILLAAAVLDLVEEVRELRMKLMRAALT